jgi:hypothetical protein
MPFDGRVSLVRWALRGNAVAGAGGEALRCAEMREPKCTLNLPIIIGQTPTVLNRESWSKRHRSPIAATEQSASPSLWQEAGYRCFHWRHIFNRSFRNDVNAGVIPFGKRTAIKVSSSASKSGRPMDQPDSAHLATLRDFLRRGWPPRCVDIVPVIQRAMRFLPQTVR